MTPVDSFRRMHGLVPRVLAGLLAVGTGSGHAGSPPSLLLDVDLEGQPLDQPIGTGGAGLGQPILVSPLLNAIVRNGAMSGHHLDLTWNAAPSSASTARFGFAGGVEAASDLLSITLDLHAHVASSYFVGIRESMTSARSFGGVVLAQPGILQLTDASGVPMFVHNVPFGQTLHLRWDYDLDARTYDFSLDGAPVVRGRPHGVPDDGRGIGAVIIGLDWNTPANTALGVDNLRVVAAVDRVYANGFEGP